MPTTDLYLSSFFVCVVNSHSYPIQILQVTKPLNQKGYGERVLFIMPWNRTTCPYMDFKSIHNIVELQHQQKLLTWLVLNTNQALVMAGLFM